MEKILRYVQIKMKILELWMPETGKFMSGGNRDSGNGVL